ncbi:acetate kinase [Weeksellaceae bacterium KMM 9724]|uniref:acetate/propionate family kinase n=1 Tax=Profundicola chukchiensis TaxID=2961959 RepID=UPI0024401DD0|nr:acetate kinase [Profundicola chukchiensis]MDG4949675.1 acetate kinase [Profundicola chukchiensis]
MKVLVINSGSSSIKFQLFKMPEQEVIASGLVEKIGLKNGEIHYNTQKKSVNIEMEIPDHAVGLREVVNLLMSSASGVISNVDEIEMIGHRVVHGGKEFLNTVEINQDAIDRIKSLFNLAPLHNPPNHVGIVVAQDIFPNARQIAVFDTSFHQTIPEKAHTFAIPLKFRDEHDIRLYGFHGISHHYVSQKAIEYLHNPKAKLIVIHLGNGCSMTAVKDGKSIDHSLGFGPNQGLIMGTRSGDIDQGVIFYLMEKFNMGAQEVSDLLTKKSGMLGLTGDSDLRGIEERANNGDETAQLALEMNTYRIKKYIGTYTAVLNGLDAIVFTAGIGENSELIRAKVCEDMSYFGIELDANKNSIRSKEIREISTEYSRTKVLVIPTNEELQIAKECFAFQQK